MALVIKDRVKETTTTTGTGTLTLAGAASGFQSFAAIGNANTTYYAITDSATGDWEVGLGTYTASGTTLSRDTILASSNSGSAVSLAAGSKNVFATYPAGKAAFVDDIPTNNNQLTNGAGYITGNQTITLSGDASGSGTTSIAVTVANDSHTHDTRYYTETEIGNFFSGTTAITGYSKTNWDTAYTWGNHASAGYLTGNQTITLSGDATGSGTTAITVTVADDSHSHSTSTLTGLGALATLSSVDAATITDNSVGAAELNVTGNGTTAQYLRSDGDGSFTWATPTDTNTTYSAGSGLDLTGTTFSVEPDLRDGITHVGLDTGDFISWSNNAYTSFYVNGAEDWRMVAGGAFHADGDVIAYSATISDERLKTDIKTVENALDMVNKMRGVTFTYKKDGKKSAGVVAQELEKVFPRAIHETQLPLKAEDDKEYKVVQYDQLHALLIEAIKELTDRVEELEAQAG